MTDATAIDCPKCGTKVVPKVTVKEVGPEPWRTFKVPMQDKATDTTSVFQCACGWWELRSRIVRNPL